MAELTDMPSFNKPIGLFPLPNAVLLPGAILPLQVFEPRYRTMVRDALAEEGIIAMALLRPGFEPYYHTNSPEIHPVVCVGHIEEHVQIPDGRYFINLLGVCRARVRTEEKTGEYRLAMLDPMIPPETGIEKDGEYAARHALRHLLCLPAFDSAGGIERCRAIAASPLPLGEMVDHLAAVLVPSEGVEVRQRILEEVSAHRRAQTLRHEMEILYQALAMRERLAHQWPRLGSMN